MSSFRLWPARRQPDGECLPYVVRISGAAHDHPGFELMADQSCCPDRHVRC